MGSHFFPENSPERVFQPGSRAFDVLAQSIIDESLISGCTARLLSLLKEVIYQILIQSNGDTCFASLFCFSRANAASLAFAEVILLFHRRSS
jgi:hypothetical protein